MACFFFLFLFSHAFMNSSICWRLYGSFHAFSNAWHWLVAPMSPKWASSSWCSCSFSVSFSQTCISESMAFKAVLLIFFYSSFSFSHFSYWSRILSIWSFMNSSAL